MLSPLSALISKMRPVFREGHSEGLYVAFYEIISL